MYFLKKSGDSNFSLIMCYYHWILSSRGYYMWWRFPAAIFLQNISHVKKFPRPFSLYVYNKQDHSVNYELMYEVSGWVAVTADLTDIDGVAEVSGWNNGEPCMSNKLIKLKEHNQLSIYGIEITIFAVPN